MALQTSGSISLDDIQAEFGGSNPISLSEYYRGGAYVPDTAANSGIPTSGTISLDDFYGGDATPPAPTGTFSAANFTSQTNRLRSTYYYSNNLTLSVTNEPITVSVTGLASPTIQKNSTGTLASSLSFNDGDTCRIRGLTPSTYSTSRTFTASMTGDSATFTVTTQSAPSGGGGGGKKCLALNSPVVIKGVDGAADRVATVADISVDDRLTAFTEPTMLDEDNPNWADWTIANLDNASETTSRVVKSTPYIVGEWIRVNGQLECTVPHPFLVYRNNVWHWMTAGELVVGDELLGQGDTNIAVTSVETMTGTLEVMNVGVEAIDTYYAGMIDGVYILNHNK
jgi:hypothetical protein